MKTKGHADTHDAIDRQLKPPQNGLGDITEAEKIRQQICRMVFDIIDYRQKEIDYCQGWNDLIARHPEAANIHPLLPVPPTLKSDEVAVRFLEPLYRRERLQAQIDKGQLDSVIPYIRVATREAMASIETFVAKASIESSQPVLERYRQECLSDLHQTRHELLRIKDHSLTRFEQIVIPKNAGTRGGISVYSHLIDGFDQSLLLVLQDAQLAWRFFREKSNSFLLGMAASSESYRPAVDQLVERGDKLLLQRRADTERAQPRVLLTAGHLYFLEKLAQMFDSDMETIRNQIASLIQTQPSLGLKLEGNGCRMPRSQNLNTISLRLDPRFDDKREWSIQEIAEELNCPPAKVRKLLREWDKARPGEKFGRHTIIERTRTTARITERETRRYQIFGDESFVAFMADAEVQLNSKSKMRRSRKQNSVMEKEWDKINRKLGNSK